MSEYKLGISLMIRYIYLSIGVKIYRIPELRDPRDFGFNICGRLATSLMMKVLSFIPEINYTDIFFLF